MRENLATLLDDFRRYDRGIAVVRMQGIRRRVATYGEIARQAGQFAALLEERHIGPGDRVVLWAENSAEWVAAFYGIMLRGAMAVPLDAYGSVEFATRVAADVKPKLVVGDADLVRKLCNWPKLVFEEWLASLPQREAGPVDGLNHATPLQILFTSGTTGDPKGIVHTHGNVLASVNPIARGAQPYMRYERIFHPLRFLHTLPLSHVFGQTMGLWVPAIFAAEVRFENRLVAPRLLDTIKRERISVLAAVPRVMGLLKTHLETTQPELAGRIAAVRGMNPWKRWWVFRDVHREMGLKFWALISGGGTLPGPLEQFWNAMGFVVVQGYGMTETTALITLNHPFHVAGGTIGKPLPGREVKLGPDGEVLVRGPMISDATWSGGELRTREGEWLATGDIAEKQATGELKFLGRKSELIVTAAGVNIHPEDLEEAIEQEPGVAGCAVVPVETASGPEAYAVIAVRGPARQAAEAVEHANERLAEFQRVRRWAIWPEPDLPRTSTGKVRRKTVATWVAGMQGAMNGRTTNAVSGISADGDWLLALIAATTGETPSSGDDELLLSEDLHLDSLGRVQLGAALEERLGALPEANALDEVRTLGELRRLVGNEKAGTREQGIGNRTRVHETELGAERSGGEEVAAAGMVPGRDERLVAGAPPARSPDQSPRANYVYPKWPWRAPVRWIRAAFLEAVAQPLVWFLANPRVVVPSSFDVSQPMLVIGNHVTEFDGPLVEYALPGRMRRRMAVAMAGEMLEDYRHFRNPERSAAQNRFMLLGPVAYLLVTALYNVFPLPRRRDFQRSFAHAGEALDRGLNVMVFPEGTRSAAGELARFRPGIGLLVKQAQAAVLPVAIRGLGELKARGHGWFRSGKIEVHVGEPLRFSAEATEAEITTRLHAEVQRLLGGQ
jgi:long-chain acyl-CoA synthetase